jgi:hypothetical protein
MSLREAAQQALEALSPMQNNRDDTAIQRAIVALRAALEQREQEPVAWRTFDGEGGYDYRTHADNEDYAAEWAKRNPQHVGWVEPLYTLSAALAEPVQEQPICDECGRKKADGWALYCVDCVAPVFAPPPMKPLSDEEIERLLSKHERDYAMVKFARAVEAAHGIKEGA